MDPNEAAPEVEAPIEAEAQPAVEAPAASEDAPQEQPKPHKNRRTFEKRIDQLTAQLRQKERELEAARSQSTPKPEAAPKRDDFDDYESYIEAKAEYKALQAAEKRLSDAEKERKEREAQAQEVHAQTQFMEARERTLDKGAEAYPDFEAVVSQEDLSITPVMADAILVSDKGHELWYHLGKNPEIADRIAGLPPVQQIYELGQLAATLSGRKPSGAPKPTTTINPRGANANALSDRLGIDEWMKKRREEVRKSF